MSESDHSSERDGEDFGRQLYRRHRDELERLGFVQKWLVVGVAAITAFAWVLLGGSDE